MKFGDVILAKFPFTDGTSNKFRPVLVLANPSGNNTIVSKISSVHRPQNKHEVAFSSAALHKHSFVHLDIIFTLHTSLVGRKIGHISEPTVSIVKDQLKTMLRL